jgi:hypothetical protein
MAAWGSDGKLPMPRGLPQIHPEDLTTYRAIRPFTSRKVSAANAAAPRVCAETTVYVTAHPFSVSGENAQVPFVGSEVGWRGAGGGATTCFETSGGPAKAAPTCDVIATANASNRFIIYSLGWLTLDLIYHGRSTSFEHARIGPWSYLARRTLNFKRSRRVKTAPSNPIFMSHGNGEFLVAHHELFQGFEKKIHGTCPEPAVAMQKRVWWLATALLGRRWLIL